MYVEYLPNGYILNDGDNSYRIIDCIDMDGARFSYKAECVETRKTVRIIELYIRYFCLERCEDNRIIVRYERRKNAFQRANEDFFKKATEMVKMPRFQSFENALKVFRANNTVYLVVEYIEGKTLRDCVFKGGQPMLAEEILPKFEQLMADIQKLHEAGYIHEGINPERIKLTDRGELYLCGYAEAKMGDLYEDEIDRDEPIKQPFSPIEKYSNKPSPTPETIDVYSLAATMYYCLTGKVPPDTMDRLEDDPLIPPNDLGAGLKDYQQAAILRALSVPPPTAKTPGKNPRYKTMAEFKDALQGKNKLKNMIKRRVWKK